MKVNLKKTIVLCNGAKAKKLKQKVWRTGRLPPLIVTRVMTFKQAMNRVLKTLYGAEVGGMSVARVNDVRVSARKALGKGANLRRSSPLERMA
eukprot:2026227-Amphidinium_carterae.2